MTDQVLGTGSPLEVKLKPGQHTITVVVDDGTDQVEERFVIREKEEGAPGPGLVAALAAVVLDRRLTAPDPCRERLLELCGVVPTSPVVRGVYNLSNSGGTLQ